MDIWCQWEFPDGHNTYINNITGLSQNQPPPQFRGGILTDHMGSGKSLCMITLIAHNRVRHVAIKVVIHST
ncbi:hypothetical protein F5B20DRAFT_540967, partial [Whalleya microplaca]